MNILKIKDPQGNWIDIPALKGDKGDKGDPGISPTIDSTLSQANQAADAKAVGDKIDEITLTVDETLTQSGQVADAKVTGDALNTKADQNGYYENLNVGVADQLASKNYIEDNEAYTFRPTANGAKVGTREFDTIVGGSIVWNQKMPKGTEGSAFSGTNWNCYNNGDGSLTIEVTGEAASATTVNNTRSIPSASFTIGHKYLWLGSKSGIRVDLKNTSIFSDTVFNCTKSEYSNVALIFTNLPQGLYKIYPMLIDLTQMFGSEIADYIYNLERTTPGAGVAWFKKYFPNDYYDYNPGELMHVSGVSAHKMRDAEENVVATYPLDSSLTLRGIPKLTADGDLTYDGDIYKPDGTVERRYGIVDLGTLNFTYIAASDIVAGYFRVKVSTIPSGTPMLCKKYKTVTASLVSSDNNQIGAGSYLYIRDDEYSDATSFKAAMSGVYLVYKLGISTTETAQPYQSPQIIDPYGTEEYVTTSIVPVGHQTQYPEDLRAKIESLPWDFANLIAPVETTYKATQNYTTGSLFIVDNILYKATANIANGGTITPNTNCTATTLAEIIAAL